MSSSEESWWMRMSRPSGTSRWDVRPNEHRELKDDPKKRSSNPPPVKRRVIDASPPLVPARRETFPEGARAGHVRSESPPAVRASMPVQPSRNQNIPRNSANRRSSEHAVSKIMDLTPSHRHSTSPPAIKSRSFSPPIAAKTSIARLAAAPPLQHVLKRRSSHQLSPPQIHSLNHQLSRQRQPIVSSQFMGVRSPEGKPRPQRTSLLSQIISPHRQRAHDESPLTNVSIPKKRSALISKESLPPILLPGADSPSSSSSSAYSGSGSGLFSRGEVSAVEYEEENLVDLPRSKNDHKSDFINRCDQEIQRNITAGREKEELQRKTSTEREQPAYRNISMGYEEPKTERQISIKNEKPVHTKTEKEKGQMSQPITFEESLEGMPKLISEKPNREKEFILPRVPRKKKSAILSSSVSHATSPTPQSETTDRGRANTLFRQSPALAASRAVRNSRSPDIFTSAIERGPSVPYFSSCESMGSINETFENDGSSAISPRSRSTETGTANVNASLLFIADGSSEMDVSVDNTEAEVSSDSSMETLMIENSDLYDVICKKCAAWLPILSVAGSLHVESSVADKLRTMLYNADDGDFCHFTDDVPISASKLKSDHIPPNDDVPISASKLKSDHIPPNDDLQWVQMLTDSLQLLRTAVKGAMSVVPDRNFGLLSILCERWMRVGLDLGIDPKMNCREVEKVVLSTGIALTYQRKVFENPLLAKSLTLVPDSETDRKSLESLLNEMGECNLEWQEDGLNWEVVIQDDLINLHGTFPVFDESPNDVIFKYIGDNISTHLCCFDNGAPTKALRDSLRKDYKDWLIQTNNDLNDLDYKLRFGCLPIRALLSQHTTNAKSIIGPSGQWPWSMPGLQYANASGKVDKILLEGQWFQLGLKAPLYRMSHDHPLALAPQQLLTNDNPTRIVPYHPPTLVSRQDILAGRHKHILNWPQSKSVRRTSIADSKSMTVKESPQPEAADEEMDIDGDIVTTYLAKGSSITSTTAENVRSVVGPGIGWQKSALVESGVERLVDQCVLKSVDDEGNEIWERAKFTLTGGSIKKQFRDHDEELVNDSTVWSSKELLTFATFVHTYGYLPRKLVPLLTNSTEALPGVSNRTKSPQQCTLLYSVIKPWITDLKSGEDFQTEFISTLIDPLMNWVNRWCSTIVGILQSSSATLGHIIDFKINNAHLIPPLQAVESEENPALDIAESGGPIDAPPIVSRTPDDATMIVGAKSSVILPSNVETVIVQSGNEFSIMDRTGHQPIEPVKLINKIRHQISKPQFGEEDMKARLAAHTLRQEKFIERLHEHLETHSSPHAKPADTLFSLFLAKETPGPQAPTDASQGLKSPANARISRSASPKLPTPLFQPFTTPPLVADWQSSQWAIPQWQPPVMSGTPIPHPFAIPSSPPRRPVPYSLTRSAESPSGGQAAPVPFSPNAFKQSTPRAPRGPLFSPVLHSSAPNSNAIEPPTLEEFLNKSSHEDNR